MPIVRKVTATALHPTLTNEQVMSAAQKAAEQVMTAMPNTIVTVSIDQPQAEAKRRGLKSNIPEAVKAIQQEMQQKINDITKKQRGKPSIENQKKIAAVRSEYEPKIAAAMASEKTVQAVPMAMPMAMATASAKKRTVASTRVSAPTPVSNGKARDNAEKTYTCTCGNSFSTSIPVNSVSCFYCSLPMQPKSNQTALEALRAGMRSSSSATATATASKKTTTRRK